MKLFLLRHGKAAQGVENQKDFDRPLNEKGEKQIKKIGKFLQNQGIEKIVSSSALRTKQTTKIVNKALEVEDVTFDKSLYLASSMDIHELINGLVTAKTMLVVGHNYGISELIDYYTGNAVVLSTGCMAIIEFDVTSSAHFSRFAGTLKEIVSPKNI
ncbi:hypothetical protein DNU06_11585 [Putridiphycobacter roseus]|uniref:Phosphohistidine phosphatase n=1 Tax=Putridiphycobacter roseus TaxID=2219161 RepID=A0A2W1MXL7_9FLAO|nr:histidine phosphatase family protein [Putridiphycobacter roseus]PZE16889.1 hypothetical protein DNU06_11585 [Putridiphycobacter roseus]